MAAWQLDEGDCLAVLHTLPADSVPLICTSPPYGIDKKYVAVASGDHRHATLVAYCDWLRPILRECVRVLRPDGALALQVGTWVDPRTGTVHPLDCVLYTELVALGLHLRNRIVWHFGSGLHARHRLSGRHETLMWWSRSATDYTFHLDPIRVPQLEPGRRGRNGQLSGNPLGKNPSDVWLDLVVGELDAGLVVECPNVKGGHVEKQACHPCQMPVELCERAILAWSRPGDLVVDPFCGTGSTLLAAVRNGRTARGMELSPDYGAVVRQRLAAHDAGTPWPVRELGTQIPRRRPTTASTKLPEEWRLARLSAKRPRTGDDDTSSEPPEK